MLTTKLKEQTYQTRALCPLFLLSFDASTFLLLASILVLFVLSYFLYKSNRKNAQLEQYNFELNRAFLENYVEEKVIQDRLHLLQLTLNNIPHYIFWKDADSNYLGCNQLFAEIAGLKSPQEIVGKNDFELGWNVDDAMYYHQADEAIMATGEAIINIEEFQDKDGNDLLLRTNKIPLKEKEGTVIGILGIFEDVSERKIIEEKLSK